MNNNKTRQGLWVVVGAYLAYTGFTLAQSVIKDKPNNFMLLLAAGILFIGIGIAVVIRSVKELRKPEEDSDDITEESEEEQEEEQELVETEEHKEDITKIEEDARK